MVNTIINKIEWIEKLLDKVGSSVGATWYGTIVLKAILLAAFIVLWERRLIASIQRRRGPNQVGKGFLQPIADAFKLVLKENLVPSQTNILIFVSASSYFFIISLLLWSVIPIGALDRYLASEYDLLYVYAFSSLSVIGLIVAGWSSISKYPLLGAVRTAAQLVSYEIVIGTILVVVVLGSQSISFTDLQNYQHLYGWLFIKIPLLSFIFFIAVLAELNRTPFDLPESEAELVAGYNVEYSGFLFALFMLAEYINIIFISGLIVMVFLGGGSPCAMYTTMKGFLFFSRCSAIADQVRITGKAINVIPNTLLLYHFLESSFLTNIFSKIAWICDRLIAQAVAYPIFIGKTIFISMFIIFVRAHLPRYRFDQLLHLCWKTFLPYVVAYVFGSSAYLILQIYIIG